ncbi:MAG TPA: type II toxin-antitoxin system HicA family toxin [Thermoanaerobaculia bacterium]|nr:type II toxin-antitoxin system HicA family toxin [Thermoanaerobaculia bacterium]
MTARTKILAKILSGTSSQNISFDELVGLLEQLGFATRVSGSHRIFSHEGVVEILNLQPRRDGTAKPYQLKQVRNVIVRYKLAGEVDGS